MTDRELSSLLREHIAQSEPPFTIGLADVVAHSHVRRARRRWSMAAAGVAAASVATFAVVMPALRIEQGSPHPGSLDPATRDALANYDPAAMPALMDTRIRSAVGSSMDLGPAAFTASSDQTQDLAAKIWAQATSVATRYGWPSDPHRLRVWLGHGQSYAEGAACGAQGSFDFSCRTSTLDDGTVVITTISAALDDPLGNGGGWMVVTPDQLRDSTLPPGIRPRGHLDRGEVYFLRSVTAVRSGTFVTSAQEAVKARSYDEATDLFDVPVASLRDVATDPVLVIPQPKRLELAGTWDVTALIGNDGKSVLPSGRKDLLSVDFNEDAVIVQTGCKGQWITGAWKRDGDDISFSKLTESGGGACPSSGLMLDRLQQVEHISRVSADAYQLHAANWMILVELRTSSP